MDLQFLPVLRQTLAIDFGWRGWDCMIRWQLTRLFRQKFELSMGSNITERAKAADESLDFSARIRQGLPETHEASVTSFANAHKGCK